MGQRVAGRKVKSLLLTLFKANPLKDVAVGEKICNTVLFPVIGKSSNALMATWKDVIFTQKVIKLTD